ncbi:MAG: glycosyltransferase family 39 protein [Deltaproteobacteria bacterium]|nr:glycosyltransferase family 39 protein [Deltaproteobacteria bacterium]
MNNRRRPNLFLAAGILCHITAFALFAFQKEITSYAPLKQFVLLLTAVADYLWSVPSVLTILIIVLCTPWFYYSFKAKRKGIRYSDWFIHSSLLSFIKISLLSLFFIFTLFPLRWAQLGFTRSPESFPDYTPFGFILILLSVVGIIFYCLYGFDKLPLMIGTLVEKVTSRFYKWKETHFIGSLLILCFLITAIIAYTVLDHIPHVLDSIAQLFHAKIFKMGKLYASLPPHKEFFDYAHVINDAKWYSQYPPGHSLLLMMGLFVGAPWLIGPLLGTLSLFVFYLLVKEIYGDHQTTYLSSLFLLLSPFFLFMSSSYMNHNSTMFFIVLFLYSYSRIFSSNSSTHALTSGLSLGYAINIRPLTALAIGFPFICNLIIHAYKKREIKTRNVLVFFTGLSLMLLLLLLYNDLTNGSPFLFGYQEKYQTLGFIGNAQGGPPHTLKGGVINTSNNLIGLNQYLFEWPVPSLIFIFILFSIPIRKSRWDWLFFYSSLSLVVSHFFYYHQDYIFGPRFYYSLMPFMIVLTVRGFLGIPSWLEKNQFNRGKTKASLYLLVVLCSLYTFSFSFPSLIKKYSNDYWWVTDKLHKTVEKQGITNAIVFIDCWHPLDLDKPHLIYYGSGFQFNSPDLTDEVIYALDLKDKNRELMEAFPDRNYYFCNFFWDRNIVAW